MTISEEIPQPARDHARPSPVIDAARRREGLAPRRHSHPPEETGPVCLPPHRALSGRLAALARRHGVPGAQLAVHHRGETHAVDVGELEFGTGDPVTRQAAFPVGSITKSFTAAVAMVLVVDGDLELDAPVHGALPELGDLGTEFTLRRLLSHTSGLADGPDAAAVSTTSLRRYVLDHCHRRNLVLPPGTGFSYSNLGFSLVGRLIETVTGMSWVEAAETILLRPLGIDPAFIGVRGSRPTARPVATGHSANPATGRVRPVDQSLAPAEAPAGALALSATDLVALGGMHAGRGVPTLLPAADAERQRRPVPAADPFGLAHGWGCGLAVFHEGGGRWVGHDGNADGTACYLRIDPDAGWIVALTSNSNTGLGLWQDVLDELAGLGVPTGRPADVGRSEPPLAPPAGCAGTYRNGDVEYVVDVGADGQTRVSADGDGFERMTFYPGLVFTLENPASGRHTFGGRFLRNPNTGELDGIQVAGRVARRNVDRAQVDVVA